MVKTHKRPKHYQPVQRLIEWTCIFLVGLVVFWKLFFWLYLNFQLNKTHCRLFSYLHVKNKCLYVLLVHRRGFSRASSVESWWRWGSSSPVLKHLLCHISLKLSIQSWGCENSPFTSTSVVHLLENLNKNGQMGIRKAWFDVVCIHKWWDDTASLHLLCLLCSLFARG